MQEFLKEKDKEWVQNVYWKLEGKIEKECGRMGEKIPYIAENGRYQKDLGETNIAWWTNGFRGGLLWQLYHATGKQLYLQKAMQIEERLDRALEDYENLDHDVGFMWMHTAVADYRLTGNHKSYARGMHAANILAGRFNVMGNYIRAWNGDRHGQFMGLRSAMLIRRIRNIWTRQSVWHISFWQMPRLPDICLCVISESRRNRYIMIPRQAPVRHAVCWKSQNMCRSRKKRFMNGAPLKC